MDVDIANHLRVAMRGQQAINQRLQAINFVDDDLRVFGQFWPQVARLQFHRQQLRRAANATQRVLDLMRQIAGQLLGRLHLVERALLAILSGLLGILDQLDHHQSGVKARAVDLRDDHLHGQRFFMRPSAAAQQGIQTTARIGIAGDRPNGFAELSGVDKPFEQIAALHRPP